MESLFFLIAFNYGHEPIQRARSVTRSIRLEYLTVGWNVLEGMIAVLSGVVAGSVALIGFGIDSDIESATGVVLLWRLHEERNGKNAEELEQRALKFMGVVSNCLH